MESGVTRSACVIRDNSAALQHASKLIYLCIILHTTSPWLAVHPAQELLVSRENNEILQSCAKKKKMRMLISLTVWTHLISICPLEHYYIDTKLVHFWELGCILSLKLPPAFISPQLQPQPVLWHYIMPSETSRVLQYQVDFFHRMKSCL